MKFEELSAIWNSTDEALDRSIQINKELVKNIGINKIRSGLYEIKFTAFFGIITGVFFLMFLSRFIIQYYYDLKFLVPALILLLLTAFSLVMEIYKLTLVYTLNSKSPVSEAQRKLLTLKKLEILDVYSLYIIIPLFAAPFMIVMAKAFLHFNLYIFSTWLISFTAGSVVIAVILIFFLKRYPSKKLSQSIAFLNELKESED